MERCVYVCTQTPAVRQLIVEALGGIRARFLSGDFNRAQASPILTIAAVIATLMAAAVAFRQYMITAAATRIPTINQPRVIADWRKYSLPDAPNSGQTRRVSIVVFSDYRCGHCYDALKELRSLQSQFPNRVQVFWRSFPFLGPESMSAALAATCARRIGRFEALHERLFREAVSRRAKNWTAAAAASGIRDTAAFGACLMSDLALQDVRLDLAAAQELAVHATPAFLLDSLLFRGTPPIQYLRTYVRNSGEPVP